MIMILVLIVESIESDCKPKIIFLLIIGAPLIRPASINTTLIITPMNEPPQ